MNDTAFEAMESLAQANNYFAVDLFQVLRAEPGNLFFSPVSVHIALALMFIGSAGNTAKELAKGLHLPEEKKLVEDGGNAIMSKIMEPSDVVLRIANKLFLKEDYDLHEGFKHSASRFLASVEEVNFSEEAKTRNLINKWVDNSTNHKIQEIIPPGILSSLTRMVLVNAIYFKGDWMKSFKKENTRSMPFHSPSSSPKQVEMMNVKGKFKYSESKELKAQALILPYKGENVGMLVILPKEANGLENVEEKLKTLNPLNISRRMTEEEVYVFLPKFKIEYSSTLKDSLKTLGMTSMFDERTANFSGITDERILVTEVLHKAFIEVNEEGTEAAAATVVVSASRSITGRHLKPYIFKADRPFIFCLLDWTTGAVLFIGRFVSPPA